MPDDDGKEKRSTKTRREILKREGHEITMPQCTAGYVLNLLFEMGLTMGDRAITHGEIQSYQHNTGVRLSPWECKTIKKLSDMYLIESHKATAKDAETAWEEAPPYMSAKYRTAVCLQQSLGEISET